MNLTRPLKWREKFYYDRREALRATSFFERELVHIEGEHAGHPFTLQPWQRRMIRRIFGWKRRSDKTRKHRRVFLFIAKKNGKSALAAGLGLYMLLADREEGANVVSAAADTEQADLVFKFAKENVARNAKLRGMVGRTFRRSIVVHSTASSYKVLSSTADTKHGPNLSCILIDELHAQPNRELVDTLVAGTISRRQPLTVYMTTAGHDLTSICGETYEYACKIRDGLEEDDEFLPIVFEPGKDDDWRKPETWRKANPSLGVTIKEEVLAADCKRAQALPREENKFKRLHLNIWTEQDVRWLPMDKWKLCASPFKTVAKNKAPDSPLVPEDLIGLPCYGGLDLAKRIDLAALALVFEVRPHEFAALLKFWYPTDSAEELRKKGRVSISDWIKSGHIVGTPGNAIDFDYIEAEIIATSKLYRVRQIGFDPYAASQLTQSLDSKQGITMVPVRQGYLTISQPAKELESLVETAKFQHFNNPVLNWMASNVCVIEDTSRNIKPVKPKDPNLKIDGIIGILMALSRIMVDDKIGESVYHERGILTL